jgi:hypothetical protein
MHHLTIDPRCHLATATGSGQGGAGSAHGSLGARHEGIGGEGGGCSTTPHRPPLKPPLAPPDPVTSGHLAPPTGQIWPLPRALDQCEEEEPATTILTGPSGCAEGLAPAVVWR